MKSSFTDIKRSLKRQSRVLRVRKEPKKTQTYVPESLLPKQIRSPQHPFFRTFIPMPFSTNYSSPNFVKILTQLHRPRKWWSIESSQIHLKVTIDRAFWLVNCQKRHRAKESLILLASHEGIGFGFGFGFGFTTPFGWLVYLLWFWFYDSQVKTALRMSNLTEPMIIVLQQLH